MINSKNILETIKMVDELKFDIRTITLGISLLDCADTDGKKSRDKIYDKIARMSDNFVATVEKTEKEFGIPIINKRISKMFSFFKNNKYVKVKNLNCLTKMIK